MTSTGDPRYNRLWTLMGVPCVNVPTLVAEAGITGGSDGDRAARRRCRERLAAASFVEDALRK